MPVTRQQIFAITLAVAVLTFCGLAVLGFYFVRARQHYEGSSFAFSGESFIQEDPLIGYSQRANITMSHTAEPRYTVHTDGNGARVSGRGIAADKEVDILAIGGSFTWGHGVDEPDTFARLVAERGGWTLANVAIASYGMTASMLSLEKYRHLRPRVVVYGFIADHVRRSLVPCAPSLSPLCRTVAFVDFDELDRPFISYPERSSAEYYDYLDDVILAHEFAFSDIYWAIRRDLLNVTGDGQRGLNHRYSQHASGEPYRAAAIELLVREMVQRVEELGAELVVVYIPTRGSGAQSAASLEEAFAVPEREIAFVDVTAPFAISRKEHGPEILKVAPNDEHPSAFAHELVADELFPVVTRLLRASDQGTTPPP